MGPPGPSDDVVMVGEEFRDRRFEVAVPQNRLVESALQSASNHAPHDHSAGQVEPHEQVRTPQEQRPRLTVLPFSHPGWLSSEGSHVEHEVVAGRPVGPVVQSINLRTRNAHGGGDPPGECRLTRAGCARDEDSQGRRGQSVLGCQHQLTRPRTHGQRPQTPAEAAGWSPSSPQFADDPIAPHPDLAVDLVTAPRRCTLRGPQRAPSTGSGPDLPSRLARPPGIPRTSQRP